MPVASLVPVDSPQHLDTPKGTVEHPIREPIVDAERSQARVPAIVRELAKGEVRAPVGPEALVSTVPSALDPDTEASAWNPLEARRALSDSQCEYGAASARLRIVDARQSLPKQTIFFLLCGSDALLAFGQTPSPRLGRRSPPLWAPFAASAPQWSLGSTRAAGCAARTLEHTPGASEPGCGPSFSAWQTESRLCQRLTTTQGAGFPSPCAATSPARTTSLPSSSSTTAATTSPRHRSC